MSRTLSANNRAEVGAQITRPARLVYVGFSTPLYLSSREAVSYAGNTWAAASLKFTSGGLSIYNVDLSYSAQFLANPSGTAIRIFDLYGDAPFSRGDVDQVFDGIIGAVPRVGDWIELRLSEIPPKKVPRLTVSSDYFHNLPADGTQIVTPAGVFTLNRAE